MHCMKGSFARKQLEKHGWSEGAGLGAREHGISEAIKVKIKKGTAGVGHDLAKEFTHHWWDHAFNKAAASITVEHGEDGVVVKKKEKTKKERNNDAKKTLYSNFIKSSLLTNGTEEAVEREGGDGDACDEEMEQKTPALMLPEDELFQKCGGRTAHKGARHGLKLNGKLARVEQQEKLLLEKYRKNGLTISHSDSSPAVTEDGSQNSTPTTGVASPEHSRVASPEQSREKSKKKKKGKKRKQEPEEEEDGRPERNDEAENIPDSSDKERCGSGELHAGKRKRKKEKLDGDVSAEDDGSPSHNVDSSVSEHKKVKKKRRTEKETDAALEGSVSKQSKKSSRDRIDDTCVETVSKDSDCFESEQFSNTNLEKESKKKAKKKKEIKEC